jgi:hypothetical protein
MHTQVARIQDFILAATASSTGSLSLLLMQLPPIPGATTADLVVSDPSGSTGCLPASGRPASKWAACQQVLWQWAGAAAHTSASHSAH